MCITSKVRHRNFKTGNMTLRSRLIDHIRNEEGCPVMVDLFLALLTPTGNQFPTGSSVEDIPLR